MEKTSSMGSTVPIVVVILVVSSFSLGASQNACVPRSFGYDSVVCVCNSTYCDSGPRFVPHAGRYAFYQTSRAGERLDRKIGHFRNRTVNDNRSTMISVTFRPDEKYQTMHGFGGAFTDATGINIMRMSQKTQRNIIHSYFGVNGSRYTLGRVPIGGTDFSTRPYTYDDHDGDVRLNKFALTSEDYRYKIPVMKAARMLSPGLRFISAAWSAPAWMKTDDDIVGRIDLSTGYLGESYYQPFAEYLTRFLEEYRNEGLEIWAITSGNEPSRIFDPSNNFNSMGWTAPGLAKFLARYLAPTIARSPSNDTVILILDDQRFLVPSGAIDLYRNVGAYNATVGIAIHWYADRMVTPEALDITHQIYPDRFLLLTEGCVGFAPKYSVPVALGDWGRAESYMLDLIQNYQHWVTGFTDWNLVLDRQGGPNWVRNFVDAPIIVNPETDEFYKQPIYYALAHFSKFIPPGSMRIGTENTNYEDAVAFLTPENEIVYVMYNRNPHNLTILVSDPEQGHTWIEMLPQSIGTLIYKR